MSSLPCPSCGRGVLETRSVENKEVKLGGVTLIVPNATIRVCTVCGSESYPAKELRQWQLLREQQLAGVGQACNATQIKTLRDQKGLSVAQFASLMGVTRQAAYNWENETSCGMKFGPASLLVALLNIEGSLGTTVFDQLVAFAHERKQLLDIRPSNVSSIPLTRERPAGAVFFPMPLVPAA